MIWKSLYIEGLGVYLPQGREYASEVVESGHFSQTEHDKTGQRSVVVAKADQGESAPEMAVNAARTAIRDSGRDGDDIALLVHAVVLHNGLEAWNCGAYIQDQLGLATCMPIEIRVACAGAIVGMEMTGRWFGGRGRGLVTASDVWAPPLFDRWTSDNGLVYGDAGAAAVVGPTGGPFRILSTSLATDPRLEAMHRGAAPTTMPTYGSTRPLDLSERVNAFAYGRGIDEFWTRNERALRQCAHRALSDAATAHSDIHTWIVPNFGNVLLRKQCFDPLGITADQTLTEVGHDIGHTGAADPLLGLHLLRERGVLSAGDRVMLVGIGVGFTWGCAVVEYTGHS